MKPIPFQSLYDEQLLNPKISRRDIDERIMGTLRDLKETRDQLTAHRDPSVVLTSVRQYDRLTEYIEDWKPSG